VTPTRQQPTGAGPQPNSPSSQMPKILSTSGVEDTVHERCGVEQTHSPPAAKRKHHSTTVTSLVVPSMPRLTASQAALAAKLSIGLTVAGNVLLISAAIGSVLSVAASACGLSFERFVFVIAALGLLARAARPQSEPGLSRFVGHDLSPEQVNAIARMCSSLTSTELVAKKHNKTTPQGREHD
jgi:hypothetical protein